eukprot:403356461
MGDKILLNYKGNLDISDIPGALTGSKMSNISKIHGRDYINVHDIPGAIPKINVGYTGNYRLDEQGLRGYQTGISSDKQISGNTDLIGRPKLRANYGSDNYQSHQRGGSVVIQSQNPHNNYNMINGQQVDHSQLYQSLIGKEMQQQSNSGQMEKRDLFSQNSLNDRDAGYYTQRQVHPEIRQVRYEDTLDKFMNQNKQMQRQDSQLNQYKTAVPSQVDNQITPRNNFVQHDQSLQSGLLSARNRELTKSTANLILKPKEEDDLFANLGQKTNRYMQPKQEKEQNNMTHRKQADNQSPVEDSPHQVQRKIKDLQSQAAQNDNTKASTLHNSSNKFLDQLSGTKQPDSLRHSLKQKHSLFNINPSTIPDQGHFDIKQSQGLIKRSLNLAPSTHLGQHHKEEIDESILHREYTKLGGSNLNVQMPNEINNIQYHRHNPMKDYTYSALTGAYYYRAPN